MSVDRPYLRSSLQEAKDQLKRQIDQSNKGSPGKTEMDTWYEMTYEILTWMFTTDEVAEEFKKVVERVRKEWSTPSTQREYMMREGGKYLRTMMDSLTFYVPPAGTSLVPERKPAVATAARTPNFPVERWEFHTTWVGDPTTTGDSGPFDMGKQLTSLSRDGWELVSAAPGRQKKRMQDGEERIFTEFYRLFLKRPYRSS